MTTMRQNVAVGGGLRWAFQNLSSSQLYLHGAAIPPEEPLSGLPIYVIGGSSITKAQFGKLLKQVTSVPNIYVHDGAIASSLKSGATVRAISDSPSPLLSFSTILWETSTRAVSQDSRPLTVYVSTSISATKQALATLSAPIIFARGGLPLSARILVFGDSVVLLFASEDAIKGCGDPFVRGDVGVILSSDGVAPLFGCGSSNVFKLPAAAFLAAFDCSGVIPSVSKLTPGQAAFHFLAGFQNGLFMPAYVKGPSSVDALELAKALLIKFKHHRISSYLVNANGEGKGKDFGKLVESALSEDIPLFQAEGGDLGDRYTKLLSSRFGELPEGFSF